MKLRRVGIALTVALLAATMAAGPASAGPLWADLYRAHREDPGASPGEKLTAARDARQDERVQERRDARQERVQERRDDRRGGLGVRGSSKPARRTP